MKQYVLTVSQTFPAYHKRAGEPTGFPLAIKHYDKIHTIRGNYELWAKRFDSIYKGDACLSVRVWDGKPYNSKQSEIFRYQREHGIGIQKVLFDDYLYSFLIDDKRYTMACLLAERDGLSDDDFEHWFCKHDFSKPMAIIHFTDFRYN